MRHASAAGCEFLHLPLDAQSGNLGAGAGRSRHVLQPGGDEFRRADYRALLADTGYCGAAQVQACEAQEIVPMLAMKRESHHIPVLERFAADAPAPGSGDLVLEMAHQLKTKAGRALYELRKQTVEPRFGIIKQVIGWRQMSMRRLDTAL